MDAREEKYKVAKKVGENIKSARLENGLTQQELASMINVEKSAMSRIESGRTNPFICSMR